MDVCSNNSGFRRTFIQAKNVRDHGICRSVKGEMREVLGINFD